MIEAIYIPQLLKTAEHKEVIEFEEFLPDLETLTPLRGRMQVTHQGTYLEVKVKAETIVTLTCDRCLKQYNHRLRMKTSELIWLEEPSNQKVSAGVEIEVELEDLVESLPPQGYFQPSEWLYQQMCLEMPLRKLCDSQCQGIQIHETMTPEPAADSRWASLEALKRQLPG